MLEMGLKHYFTTAGVVRGILDPDLEELHWEKPNQCVLRVLWMAYNTATDMLCQSLFSATKQTKMFSLHFLPLVIVHSAGAGRQPLSDNVVPPVPAHGGLPQTQNGLFVAQNTSVVGSTGVCRVSQPLDIVRVGTCTQTHTHT